MEVRVFTVGPVAENCYLFRHDDSDECVPSEPAKGFKVDVYRYFERAGKRVKTETDHVRYSPTPEVICDDEDDDDD